MLRATEERLELGARAASSRLNAARAGGNLGSTCVTRLCHRGRQALPASVHYYKLVQELA
jgi:hypothetical protein